MAIKISGVLAEVDIGNQFQFQAEEHGSREGLYVLETQDEAFYEARLVSNDTLYRFDRDRWAEAPVWEWV